MPVLQGVEKGRRRRCPTKSEEIQCSPKNILILLLTGIFNTAVIILTGDLLNRKNKRPTKLCSLNTLGFPLFQDNDSEVAEHAVCLKGELKWINGYPFHSAPKNAFILRESWIKSKFARGAACLSADRAVFELNARAAMPFCLCNSAINLPISAFCFSAVRFCCEISDG